MQSIFLMALALGLRHGVDPDHLAAIDGLSRIRPRATNGLFFAIGHGLVVTVLAAGMGQMLAGRAAFLGPWVLLVIGAINLWRIIRPKAHTHGTGRPVVARPILLGMLLAAGFETSSQLSVLVLAADSSAWLLGLAFSAGMIIVDGLDGYLAASTQGLAAAGSANARLASRWLGILVVVFSFGLGGAELLGVDIDRAALPLGLVMFGAVVGFRVWARRGSSNLAIVQTVAARTVPTLPV